jgi:hypothetical protein
MTTARTRFTILDTLLISILFIIFAGIVVHAPLTIWLGTIFPDASLLIKSWKEILMGAALLIAAVILQQRRRWRILTNPVILVAGLYGLLHVLLLSYQYENVIKTLAGLLIDLRYILFFVLVVVAATLYPTLRRPFVITFLAGAVIVCLFAALQVFVLPPDVLAAIGYNDTTITPFLTVDENPDYVRINSTLRGPNPLGAYAVIVLAFVMAYMLRKRKMIQPKTIAFMSLLSIGALIAIWASYSRSALVGLIVALVIVFTFTVGRRLSTWVWISIFVVAGAIGGGLYAARETPFVSNVILHDNAETGAMVTSNQGHLDSLEEGLNRMVAQPLGAGIGSTGSASLNGSDPIIIENQYLFIAHETGWLGLGLFLVLFGMIIGQLWSRREDWLALSVLASGIGLAIVGLLLPVWVDDTVGIIWWGLAGLIIGGPYVRAINKTSKRTA